VFKGGTSLSKVFGVIERFSEDIDLSLSPVFLKLPEAGTTRTQANKWMAKAEAACGTAVRNQIGPAMEVAVAGVLGKSEPASHKLAEAFLRIASFYESIATHEDTDSERGRLGR
jgi:hypothetical protein